MSHARIFESISSPTADLRAVGPLGRSVVEHVQTPTDHVRAYALPALGRLLGGPGRRDKRLVCPSCGKEFRADAPTESVTWTGNGSPIVQRLFSAICFDDGLFYVEVPGGHSTMTERLVGEMFPKQIRANVKRLLSPQERRAFDMMLHGKRSPDWHFLRACRAWATSGVRAK
jgi:hypothetical protein